MHKLGIKPKLGLKPDNACKSRVTTLIGLTASLKSRFTPNYD